MNITIISVGKLKERYLKQAIDEYSKRLTRYCKIDIIELPDEKTPDNASEKEGLQIKDKEGQLILSKIKDNMGSLGLSKEIIKRANYKVCFSKMTFPHQLFRVMLLEQIYRAFRIMKNEPYHK